MKKKSVWIVAAVIAALLATYVFTTLASGTENDPLVSLSYLTNVFKPALKTELKNELSSDGGASSGGASFEVVQLAKGKTLTASGSAELVLRSGGAVCVVPSTASGGLSNLTSGTEQADGEKVEANSLYLISRGDGRGFQATSSCYVMVRGAYTVQ